MSKANNVNTANQVAQFLAPEAHQRPVFHAQPYSLDANGFYFTDMDDYQAKFDELDFVLFDWKAETVPVCIELRLVVVHVREVEAGGVQTVRLGMKNWSLVGLGGEELRDLVCGVDVVRFRHDVSPSLVAICSSEPPRRCAENAVKD